MSDLILAQGDCKARTAGRGKNDCISGTDIKSVPSMTRHAQSKNVAGTHITSE